MQIGRLDRQWEAGAAFTATRGNERDTPADKRLVQILARPPSKGAHKESGEMWEVAAFCAVGILLFIAAIVIQRGLSYEAGYREGQQAMFYMMQKENLKFVEEHVRQAHLRDDMMRMHMENAARISATAYDQDEGS